MIEWKPLNPSTAPDEIEENYFLIMTKERAVSATHDAMNRWFYYESEDHTVVIPYQYITHYAEFNFPEQVTDGYKLPCSLKKDLGMS